MNGASHSDPSRRVADGNKIRKLRADRGWTQEDLANEARRCVRTLYKAERGNLTTAITLTAIARALDTSIDEITAPHAADAGKAGTAAPAVVAGGASGGAVWCSIGHMPVTERVIGRERELAEIMAAYRDPQVKIVVLVGAPGAGKSALVNAWLQDLCETQEGRAAPIHACSFFLKEQLGEVVSDATFVESALRGFRDPCAEAPSLEYRGQQLARRVKETGAILVLDGLEGLQEPNHGRVKQHALALHVLLGDLAAPGPDNQGFCVITTCLNVDDLSRYESHTVKVIEVGNLAPKDGAQVLRDKGVRGTDEELEEVAAAVEGHCLSLTLLGSCLADSHNGDVHAWTEVVEVGAAGDPAEQVMKHYERMLKHRKRLAILKLLALFDGPVDEEAVRELCREPLIPGLNDPLLGMSDAQWSRALSYLRRAHLLERRDPAHPRRLGTHHVVLMYFREQLRRDHPEAWRMGNARLFEYFTAAAPDSSKTAKSLDEMMPLVAAVKHGCRAGMYREAFDLYRRRVTCGDQSRLKNVFCAVREDLQVLSLFFRSHWDETAAELDDADKTLLLCNAGLVLRAHGRLDEAEKALKKALDIDFQADFSEGAARDARHLAQLYLVSGRLGKAKELAKTAVKLVEHVEGRSGQIIPSLATLADVLHHLGCYDEARQVFREAESVGRRKKPRDPNIFELSGYRYCEFLLTDGRPDDAIRRAKQMIQHQERKHTFLLAEALGELALGCAILAKDAASHSKAQGHIEAAIEGLHRAAQRDQLPRGLIARARLRQNLGDQSGAEADLREALGIAERGGMTLHAADCHLAFARLHRDSGRQDEFESHLAVAQQLITEMGYHRRDRELDELLRGAGPSR